MKSFMGKIVLSLLFLFLSAGVPPHSAATSDLLTRSESTTTLPNEIRRYLVKGVAQEVIVEFDSVSLQIEAERMRRSRGLSVDDADILSFKAANYYEIKRQVRNAMLPDDLEIIRDYLHLPLQFVRLRSIAAAERLIARPEIKAVHLNLQLKAHLAQSLPFIHHDSFYECGYGGSDAVVAVLDTGVDYTHSDFGSCSSPGEPGCKVVAAFEAAPDDGLLDDPSVGNHGTNVAGIVLGVASDSVVAAVDVFNGSNASTSDIIDGIDWAIDQKQQDNLNIVAINLSLGTDATSSICNSHPMRTAVQDAQAAGIITVASSGNDAYTDEISFPACIPEVVSVGAVYDSNIGGVSYSNCTDSTTAADQVTCFSNSSSDLDLLAPGAKITAAGLTKYGTSQAAPHVSGAVAVMRVAFPDDSLSDTVNRLLNAGTPVTDPRNGLTRPRLDFLGQCIITSVPGPIKLLLPLFFLLALLGYFFIKNRFAKKRDDSASLGK